MTVKKCRVFENISTNSASNVKVVTRSSVSSFFQVSIPGVCLLLFSQKLFFHFLIGEKCRSMSAKLKTVCLTKYVLDTELAVINDLRGGGILKL